MLMVPKSAVARERVNNLKQSNVWKKNALVREWLEGKWLCSPQVKVMHVHMYTPRLIIED